MRKSKNYCFQTEQNPCLEANDSEEMNNERNTTKNNV